MGVCVSMWKLFVNNLVLLHFYSDWDHKGMNQTETYAKKMREISMFWGSLKCWLED